MNSVPVPLALVFFCFQFVMTRNHIQLNATTPLTPNSRMDRDHTLTKYNHTWEADPSSPNICAKTIKQSPILKPPTTQSSASTHPFISDVSESIHNQR